MTATALSRLTLTDFRSYARADLVLDGRPVYLVGPNGAGKTNLLEAVSLFTPGRGLRGSSLAEVGRRLPGEAEGRAWAVAAVVAADGEETQLGTGVESAGRGAAHGADRRRDPAARPAGRPPAPGLADAGRRTACSWRARRSGGGSSTGWCSPPSRATPPTPRPMSGRSASGCACSPTRAAADPAWLDALEARLAEAGALMAEARATTLAALQAEIDGRGERPFPQARLSLTGEWEQMAAAGAEIADIEAKLARRWPRRAPATPPPAARSPARTGAIWR